jgi:hypothetical protein
VADCLALTICGGAFEVVGFGLVAWELTRVQRQEFGTPRIVQRVRVLISRVLRRRRVVHDLSAAITARSSASARLRVREVPRPDPTLDQRVSALERNLGELEQEVDRRTEDFDQRVGRLEQVQRAMRAELEQAHRERDDERRAFLRTSVALQSWGTALFLVGAILSVLGSAVAC